MSNFTMRYYLDIINEHNELVEYVESHKSVLYSLNKLSPKIHAHIMQSKDIKTNSADIKADLEGSGLDTRKGDRDNDIAHQDKANQHIFHGPIGKDSKMYDSVIAVADTRHAQAIAKIMDKAIAKTKAAWVIITSVPFDSASYRVFDKVKDRMIEGGVQVFTTLPDKSLIIAGLRGSSVDRSIFSVIGSERETFGPENGVSPVYSVNDLERIGGPIYAVRKQFVDGSKPANVQEFPDVKQAQLATDAGWAVFTFKDRISKDQIENFLNDSKTREFLSKFKKRENRGRIESYHLANLRFPN